VEEWRHPWLPPVSDVINQVLFEHEAPSLDDVEQGLLEGSCIHTEPHIKHSGALDKGDKHKPIFRILPPNLCRSCFYLFQMMKGKKYICILNTICLVHVQCTTDLSRLAFLGAV